MILKLICEICGEVIADVDKDKLSFPLNGSMFISPDILHGVPDPFHPSLTWEDFRCPYGGTHRPIIKPNALLLMSSGGTRAIVELPEDGTPPKIIGRQVPQGGQDPCTDSPASPAASVTSPRRPPPKKKRKRKITKRGKKNG